MNPGPPSYKPSASILVSYVARRFQANYVHRVRIVPDMRRLTRQRRHRR
jgi:hypothetical protein